MAGMTSLRYFERALVWMLTTTRRRTVLETERTLSYGVVRKRVLGLVAVDGVEYEWCVVLNSDLLPPGACGEGWLFRPTRYAVATTVLERRALLARKRRFTVTGSRVMLGTALNDPWKRRLAQNGVGVSCLTSRTLNQLEEVIGKANRLRLPASTSFSPPSSRVD